MSTSNRPDHIRLTSHPDPGAKVRFPIHWGAPTARERGPVIGTVSQLGLRNVIGSHGGSYALYRALAVSSGTLDPIRRPDLTNTHPAADHRPVPAMDRAGEDRLARSVGPSGRRRVQAGDRRRPRHPPEHRHHPRAARPDRDARCARRRTAEGRRQCHPCQRQPVGGQDRDRSGVVSARHRAALRHHRDRAAAQPVRADRRHVPRAGDAPGPARVPAADRRHHGLSVRRHGAAVRSAHQDHLPRARRVQRLRRVRLRHLHLPALSHSRHRGMRPRRAAGRVRHHHLQPQGRPRARRGHQVPGLQRAQAPGGRRRGGDLLRADRMRRRRAGRALPAIDAGCAALARRAADRPLRVDERHEARRTGEPGHRRSSSACRSPTIWCRRTRMSRSRPRRPPATTRRSRPRPKI